MSLEVEGSLSFTVDGPGGSTAGTVVGSGGVVRVHAEDPVAAWDAALGSVSTGPAVLSTVADLINDEGLVVEVRGPAGLLATIGAGVNSPVGRLLTGSRRVRLGGLTAVRPLAIAQVRRQPALLVKPLAVLLAVAAGLVTVYRSRRR